MRDEHLVDLGGALPISDDHLKELRDIARRTNTTPAEVIGEAIRFALEGIRSGRISLEPVQPVTTEVEELQP